MKTEVAKDYQPCHEGNNLRNVTLPRPHFRIDHMELNWDCVIGEIVCDPCRIIYLGESVRELAFLRMDLFGGGFVAALTTAGFGRAGKGDGNKGEEDSESDEEAKKHVRRKTINED